MSWLFRSRVRIIRWDEIKDVALSSDDLSPWRRSVVLTLDEDGPLIFRSIPQPEYLCKHMRTKLSR